MKKTRQNLQFEYYKKVEKAREYQRKGELRKHDRLIREAMDIVKQMKAQNATEAGSI